MDYNEFKRKYGASAGAVPPEPVAEEPPVPIPEPIVEAPPVPSPRPKTAAPAGDKPSCSYPKAPSPPSYQTPSQTKPQEYGSGFFGGGANRPAEPGRQRSVTSRPARDGLPLGDRLRTLPWVDIIMILLTVIGLIWVIANFNAITLILAAGIGKLLQSLIGILIIGGLILGLVLILSRRRRF